MLVLKSPQDQVLSVLQAVSGIVERRHTLTVLANVLICKTDISQTASKASGSNSYLSNELTAVRNRAMSVVPRCVGFFSSSKANLRNAP